MADDSLALTALVDLDDFVQTRAERGEAWACAQVAATAEVLADVVPAADTAVRHVPPDEWLLTIEGEDAERLDARAQALGTRVASELRTRAGIDATVCIGRALAGADHHRRAEQDARTANANKLLRERDALILAAPDLPPGALVEMPPVRVDVELARLARAGDREGVRELMLSWLARCAAHPATTAPLLQQWLLGELLVVLDAATPERLQGGAADWAGSARVQFTELLMVTQIHEWSYLRIWLDRMLARMFDAPPARRPVSAALAAAERCLAQQYPDPALRLDVVAAQVNISPFHLAHLFRQERDTTFLRSLTGNRMRVARSLLCEPGLSLDVIATRVGYLSSAQFRRTFRRMHGCTPTEYRRASGEHKPGYCDAALSLAVISR